MHPPTEQVQVPPCAVLALSGLQETVGTPRRLLRWDTLQATEMAGPGLAVVRYTTVDRLKRCEVAISRLHNYVQVSTVAAVIRNW